MLLVEIFIFAVTKKSSEKLNQNYPTPTLVSLGYGATRDHLGSGEFLERSVKAQEPLKRKDRSFIFRV